MKKNKEEKETKEVKENKIFSEIKAFFTLAFIVGLVSVGGWYWYTHFYTPNKNETKEEKKNEVAEGYRVNSYKAEDGHALKVLENFVYEYDADSFDLYKIMDLDGNVIFEGEEKYTEFFVGVDGNFYFSKEELADNENVVSLYKIVDKKVELVKKIMQEGIYFAPIFSTNNTLGTERLLGFAGSKLDYLEEKYTLDTTYSYNLKGEEKTSKDYVLSSDEVMNSVEHPYYTNSSKYIKISDATGEKYGVLNIESFEVVIEPTYDDLYTNYDGKTFVAIKDNKAGIIDANQKKIVDFEYDFIDREDGFFVVAKDNKMAIMNDKYELITDFEFDYQNGGLNDMKYSYALCCTNFNTFAAYRVGDKYVLQTNAFELDRHLNYSKSITYVIKSDGTYDSITANDFVVKDDLIYSYSKNNKEYVVYDRNLTPKFSIDASKYDFSYVADLVRFGNTIAYEDKKVYFDYETGEEIEAPRDYEYSFDNVRIQYGSGKVKMLIDDKEVYTYNYKAFGEYEFVNTIENGIYYENGSEVVVLKK